MRYLVDSSVQCSNRTISFHSMRILLAWPVSDGCENSCSVLDDSRSCLKLFIHAWEVEYDLGHYAKFDPVSQGVFSEHSNALAADICASLQPSRIVPPR